MRGLWIISGLLYTIALILGVFTIKSFYSQIIPLISANVSNKSAENFVYDTLSGMCLPVDVNYKPYGMFAIPLVVDIIVVILTAFKTYRLATAVRRESGAVIVRTFPSVDTTRFSYSSFWAAVHHALGWDSVRSIVRGVPFH